MKEEKVHLTVYIDLLHTKLLFFFFNLDWHSIVEREKFADAVLICTPDRLHKVNIQYLCFLICSINV